MGQLGDGSSSAEQPTPVPVLQVTGGLPLTDVQALALGTWHSCALLNGSNVRCWGYNKYGQLGDGTRDWRRTPVPVLFGPAGTQAASGNVPRASDLPWATTSALGPDGAVFLAGITPDDVDLGGGTLPATGGQYGVLAKYDANGNYQWGQRFGIDGALYPAAVAVTDDTVVIAATRKVSASSERTEGWVGKFDQNGAPSSQVSLGYGDYTADKLAIDANGNLLVAGTYHGYFDMANLGSSYDNLVHAFVLKISLGGEIQWGVGFGDDVNTTPISLSVDSQDDVLLSLESEGALPGLWKLWSSSGAVRWRRWGWHDGVLADAEGNVYAAGSLSGTYDFKVPEGAHSGDFFIAQYDGETGEPVNVKTVSPPCRNATPPCGAWYDGHTLAIGEGGNVLVGVASGNVTIDLFAGNHDAIDFGAGVFRMDRTPDVFVAAFSPELDFRWAKHVPLILNGNLFGMHVDGNGRLAMSGTFAGSMLVDGRMLVSDIPERESIFNTFLATFGSPPLDDTTPPKITANHMPHDMTFEATGPAGAEVFFVQPTALDEGKAGMNMDCSPRPNSVFHLGTTPVTCVATDPLGNHTSKDFKVTVVDHLGPTFMRVPAPIKVEAAENESATVSFDLPLAFDAVDGERTVTCEPASGSIFPPGTTTVVCRAEDAKGNRAITGFGVTVGNAPVGDIVPPGFAYVPEPITVAAVGPGGEPVSFALPLAFDLSDGSRLVTCEPASGSLFPLGLTPVTCTAEDSRGNVAHISFSVHVRYEGSTCGNGTLEPGEQCDDGNTSNDDGCTTACERTNHTPDCSGASASPGFILASTTQNFWPIAIEGASDPDGDPVTITATGVWQDEPVSDLWCPGGTCADATLEPLTVRAERDTWAETGPQPDGRMYYIEFLATDPHGAQCAGLVTVCAQRWHDVMSCGDSDGPRYNSLEPWAPPSP